MFYPPLSYQVKELLELSKKYNWPFTELDIPDIYNLPSSLELGITEFLVLKIEFGSSGSINSSRNSINNLLKVIKDRGNFFNQLKVKNPALNLGDVKPKPGVGKRISIIAYDYRANLGKSVAEVRNIFTEDRLSSVEDILSVIVLAKDYLTSMNGVDVPYAIASGCNLHSGSISQLHGHWDNVVLVGPRSGFVKTKLRAEDGLFIGKEKSAYTNPLWCCPLIRTIV